MILSQFPNYTTSKKYWFNLWLHSLLMARRLSSVQRLYERLLIYYFCSLETLYVLLPTFCELGIPTGTYHFSWYIKNTYLPPLYRAWISSFSLLSRRILMVFVVSKTMSSCITEFFSQWHKVTLCHSGRTDLLHFYSLLQTGWSFRENISCEGSQNNADLLMGAVKSLLISLLQLSCTVQLK